MSSSWLPRGKRDPYFRGKGETGQGSQWAGQSVFIRFDDLWFDLKTSHIQIVNISLMLVRLFFTESPFTEVWRIWCSVFVRGCNDFVKSCVDILSLITNNYVRFLVLISLRMWDVKIRQTKYGMSICKCWAGLANLRAEAAHFANPAPEWPNFPFHNDSFPAPLIINNRLWSRPCKSACLTTCGLSKSPVVPPPSPSSRPVVSMVTSFPVTYRTGGFHEFHKLYGISTTCNRWRPDSGYNYEAFSSFSNCLSKFN